MHLPENMYAMVLPAAHAPLQYTRLPVPQPGPGQVLVKIIACGICRTDLHITDGELKTPRLPLIPGHEIVGVVVKTGMGAQRLQPGTAVGIPWLGYTCGTCRYCSAGQENLCVQARFTGYTLDGGYAEYTVAYEQFCFPLPASYVNAAGAPLLCAGLIGYRSYCMAGAGIQTLGLYGFGAAAHILIQVARYEGKRVYAFTRKNDRRTQQFAKELGAVWAGDASVQPPEPLDAAIIFAPAGELVPQALSHTGKAGTVVCGGIHMSDIPAFPYRLLWEERVIRSVANLTREDGEAFLRLAPLVPVHTAVQTYPLYEANKALNDLRDGKINGAAVLVM